MRTVQKYKVVTVREPQKRWQPEYTHRSFALELIDTYGLAEYFNETEVTQLWEQYSERVAAGWLMPNKEDVEEVFGVVLEEIV